MKKTFVCAGILLLTVCPLLATSNSTLQQKVEAEVKVATTQNKGAIEKNLRVDFEISESFYDERYDQNNGPYRADIACKAYALDSHWLILSGTCMRYSSGDIRELGDHEFITRYGRVVKNKINYTNNGNVMLIWTDEDKYKSPFVNVLATSSPNQLFKLSSNHTVKINTARFGTDSVKTRTLKTGSIKGNFFQLDESWTDLSGTATDPLFLISPEENEFLAAYNNGEIEYALQMTANDIFNTFDGKTSKEWFSLNRNDLEFIKTTVQKNRPNDWNKIKQRLFFNNTKIPFFSK